MFTVPEECLLTDVAHKTAGVWAIDTVNPNAWAGVMGHAKSTAVDVVLAQEIRKRGKNRLDAERQARTAGWRFALSDADLTDAGRLSAGVGIGARSHLGMADSGDIACPASLGGAAARYSRKWLGAIARGGVHVGSVYLRDCEGLSEGNLCILQDIAVDLAALRGPWILGGDWNVTPETLASSGWLALIGGHVVAPSAPTCNGKVYDFFVVSSSFRHAIIGAAAITDAQYSPHVAARLYVSAAPRAMYRRTLTAPRGYGPELPHGCLSREAATAAPRSCCQDPPVSPWRTRETSYGTATTTSTTGATDGAATSAVERSWPADLGGRRRPSQGAALGQRGGC